MWRRLLCDGQEFKQCGTRCWSVLDSAHFVFILFKKSCPYDGHQNLFWIKAAALCILGCLDLSEVHSHRNTCWQIDLLACGLYRTGVGLLSSEVQPWCRQECPLYLCFSCLVFLLWQHIRFCACLFLVTFSKSLHIQNFYGSSEPLFLRRCLKWPWFDKLECIFTVIALGRRSIEALAW